LLLLDDPFLRSLAPPKLRQRIPPPAPERPDDFARRPLRRLLVLVPLAAFTLVLSAVQLSSGLLDGAFVPEAAHSLAAAQEPFHLFNSYGLFAVMTTTRPEIVVEGSRDGTTWMEYEFRYKPGDVRRPPLWVWPHQPRLDWQMWFAALEGPQGHPAWFEHFLLRLLQGSAEVLALLERNPFGQAPPQYVRAQLYDYQFTDFRSRRANGAWWRRELSGMYFPAVTLR